MKKILFLLLTLCSFILLSCGDVGIIKVKVINRNSSSLDNFNAIFEVNDTTTTASLGSVPTGDSSTTDVVEYDQKLDSGILLQNVTFDTTVMVGTNNILVSISNANISSAFPSGEYQEFRAARDADAYFNIYVIPIATSPYVEIIKDVNYVYPTE